MAEEYRVLSRNHRHDGEVVEPGTVLSADEIPDGILRDFPTKFEPVGEGEDDGVEAEADTAEADSGTTSTDSDNTTDTSDETPEDEESGWTREELREKTRSERVQIAKEADNPDINGRSSDEDIIAVLADDEDSDEE